VVFVSDHGMTDTSHPEFIYIDDILGEGFKELEHVDGEHHQPILPCAV
jgi:predicted AlkP superfamily pyrophosphatase or phosphodiesterase